MRVWKQCFEQQIHSDISVEFEFPYHRIFHGNQAIIQNFATHCYTEDTEKRKEPWTMNLFFQEITKASLMFSKDIRLKKEGLWTLTHLSFVASRIGMIIPVHGPAIKEHSYVTFVYCVTIPMMSLVRAITISKTQFNFNPCPPESSSKNLQQLNGSISLRWHFCAFIAVKLYSEQ